MLPFEEVEHTADYALRAYGRDLRELMENAGRGMISLMVDGAGELAEVAGRLETAEVLADSAEALIVRALKEILYAVEGDWFPVGFDVASAGGEPPRAAVSIALTALTAIRPLLRGVIKAVTYHNLAVTEQDGILSITVTFDV